MFRHKVVFSNHDELEIEKFLSALSRSGLPKNSRDFLAEQVTLAFARFSRSANFSSSVFEGDGYKVTVVASREKSSILSEIFNIIKGS